MENTRRLLVLSILLLGLGSHSAAQTFKDYREKARSGFHDYKQERQRGFKEYRDRLNAEFAVYMRKAWTGYRVREATPVPDRPEPPRPVVRQPEAAPEERLLPQGKVAPLVPPAAPVRPAVPLPIAGEKQAETFGFLYYGVSCRVPLKEHHRFVLQGVDEQDVADAWTHLSTDDFVPVISACLEWRDRLRLCDWGYVRLVEELADAFTEGRQNEARLLQMYILVQSGYRVRMARAGRRLVLLLPSKAEIYEYPYLLVGGCRYYVMDAALKGETFYVFDREFPQEQPLSLDIREEPLLAEALTTPKVFVSDRYPDVRVEVSVNRNLVDFYDGYPLSNAVEVYARAPLSTLLKAQLYPALRKAVAGKSKPDAARVLLDFVQTAFAYKTDGEQFGMERPLFPDETFFYPFSDCEDRAALYAALVHDLLGLDVVLLRYPGHMATAVCFGEEVTGDHLVLGGKRYVVCDPTYVGADIGMAMPQYKQVAADVSFLF